MPVWMEVLINLMGYAGYVAIASFHKPSRERPCDERACLS